MHLLVTNDYPPKVGGIQNYLWELWRRLPQDSFEVFTTPYEHDTAFDQAQRHVVHRHDRFWLAPTPRVTRHVRNLVGATGASLVVIDPAFPLGAIGPRLGVPYAVVVHGAEASIPARLPGPSQMLRRTVGGARLVISASRFGESETAKIVTEMPPVVYVPPGVDTDRFVPMNAGERAAARRRLGFDPDAPLIVGVSRLVPRKGFDTLIEAAAKLAHRHPTAQFVIAGTGRDEARLRSLIGRSQSPARLLGYVDDADLPALYGCADIFAMLCRRRWGGLEQEGFGIVFVEAAAAGCPQLAGHSGGSAEAVLDGVTGLVVERPADVDAVAAALDALIADPTLRDKMRAASRRRAVEQFSYDLLVARLREAIETAEAAGAGGPPR